MSNDNKPKRRLTDIRFDHEGGHMALVHKGQGGAANGYTTLVFKAVNDIPETLVEKATKVSVTMDFEDFLVKFFNMYYDDAEVLAKLLGYEKEEMPSDMYDYLEDHRKYINERVEAISILKALYAKKDIKKALSELSYQDSLNVLEAQELLEKAMSSVESGGDKVSVIKAEIDSPSQPKEDSDMEKEMIQKALHEELVTKAVSEAVDVVKAQMAAQEEVLKSAQAELEVFKAKEAEAVVKARKTALAGVLAEDKVEDMFKATEGLGDESFNVIVKSLAEKAAQLEQSDLFKEAGVSGQAELDEVEKDGTAAILKAKYKR